MLKQKLSIVHYPGLELRKKYRFGKKILTIFNFKDTHKEKTPSNKTLALTEGMNMDIWVVGA